MQVSVLKKKWAVLSKKSCVYNLKSVSDVTAEEYEEVIIPGDFARDYLNRDEMTVYLNRYAKWNN